MRAGDERSESLRTGVVGIRGLAVLVLVVEVETEKRVEPEGKEALTGEGDTGVNEGTTGETTLEGTLGGIGVEGIGERGDGGAGLDGGNFKEGGLDFDLIFGGGLNEAFEMERPRTAKAGGTGANSGSSSGSGCCLTSDCCLTSL